MVYNGTEYYYVKNGQGDIIGLVDGAGSVVVNYSYDSWGKLLGVTGNTTLGNRNPFRYRGYYYDIESGLYYLKSRYYNSEVGRFINADKLVTSVNEVGCNLYAYCNNNSVKNVDGFGQACEDAMGYGNPTAMRYSKAQYEYELKKKQFQAEMVMIQTEINNLVNSIQNKFTLIKADLNSFDWKNEDEEKVLASNIISAYKGHLVIRTNLERSGSFGILFVARGENKTNYNIVRHEYGHTKQLKMLGVLKYLLFIGIPSATELGGGDYYDRLWEVTADLFGGVTREHGEGAEEAGWKYLYFIRYFI